MISIEYWHNNKLIHLYVALGLASGKALWIDWFLELRRIFGERESWTAKCFHKLLRLQSKHTLENVKIFARLLSISVFVFHALCSSTTEKTDFQFQKLKLEHRTQQVYSWYWLSLTKCCCVQFCVAHFIWWNKWSAANNVLSILSDTIQCKSYTGAPYYYKNWWHNTFVWHSLHLPASKR